MVGIAFVANRGNVSWHRGTMKNELTSMKILRGKPKVEIGALSPVGNLTTVPTEEGFINRCSRRALFQQLHDI